MAEPLGYLLTWTSYGTWLRGDRRSWVDKRRAIPGTPFQPPEPPRVERNRQRMSEPAFLLDPPARRAVETAIRETCLYRRWQLRVAKARSNHIHAVVTAPGTAPNRILADLKAYATRTLKRFHPDLNRKNWWTEGGSTRYLNDERSLLAAMEYVLEQDRHESAKTSSVTLAMDKDTLADASGT